MRRLAAASLAGMLLVACRTYDNYSPLARQDGLIASEQFARYGREQAELTAIGRSLARWEMSPDSAGYTEQADKAACFARRFPDIEDVTPDPLGHRLTVRFKSGWRAAAVPIPDGGDPEATPGIPPLRPSSCS